MGEFRIFFFLYLQLVLNGSRCSFPLARLQEVKTNNRRGLEERLCKRGERGSNAPGRANADNTVIRAQPCVSVMSRGEVNH